MNVLVTVKMFQCTKKFQRCSHLTCNTPSEMAPFNGTSNYILKFKLNVLADFNKIQKETEMRGYSSYCVLTGANLQAIQLTTYFQRIFYTKLTRLAFFS